MNITLAAAGCGSNSNAVSEASAHVNQPGDALTVNEPNTVPLFVQVHNTPEERAAVARRGGNADLQIPKFGRADGELVMTLRDKNTRAVAGGKPIVVDVVTTKNFAPRNVMVTTQYGIYVDKTSPYSVSVEIPKEASGTLEISATGIDKNFNVAEAKPLLIPIEVTSMLVGLKLANTVDTPQGTKFSVFSYMPKVPLTVKAVDADGVQRSVDETGAALEFVSANPKIASVNDRGELVAHAAGSTQLTISLRAVSLTVEVIVIDNDGIWPSAGN